MGAGTRRHSVSITPLTWQSHSQLERIEIHSHVSLLPTGNSRILEYVVTVKLDPSHRFEQSLMSSPDLYSSSSSQGEHLLLLNVTASDNSSSESVVIRNLLPARRYLINVLARNRVGLSTQSDTLSVLTDEEAPAGPPIKIEVRALDATSAKV